MKHIYYKDIRTYKPYQLSTSPAPSPSKGFGDVPHDDNEAWLLFLIYSPRHRLSTSAYPGLVTTPNTSTRPLLDSLGPSCSGLLPKVPRRVDKVLQAFAAIFRRPTTGVWPSFLFARQYFKPSLRTFDATYRLPPIGVSPLCRRRPDGLSSSLYTPRVRLYALWPFSRLKEPHLPLTQRIDVPRPGSCHRPDDVPRTSSRLLLDIVLDSTPHCLLHSSKRP